MLSPQPVLDHDTVSRREFLYVGGMGTLGLSLSEAAAQARGAAVQRRHIIFVMMSGGPSQLDTFDPKPEAPAHVRGPCRAISTAVPGLWLSESLPQLAQRANQFALIRSLYHDYAPIHETGQQLLQCGRVAERGVQFPHFGAVVARTWSTTLGGRRYSAPANIVVPGRLSDTGWHGHSGQSGGLWGDDWNPLEVSEVTPLRPEPEALKRRYGNSVFGTRLLQSRQLVERGARIVTVNLFDRLAGELTWDAHGDTVGPATVFDYRDTLVPQFDQAMAALLDDLQSRGLLNDTLVVATGEFGRTPRINDRGGRDHWTDCWSALVAGGGIRGGTVLGASDSTGSAPIDRPVRPEELTSTFLAWFGVEGSKVLLDQPNASGPLLPVEPLHELWG